MATFIFSEQTGPSLVFNPLADVLSIDGGISAFLIEVLPITSGGNSGDGVLIVQLDSSGATVKELELVFPTPDDPLNPYRIASSNLSFTDGSVLLLGDDSSATTDDTSSTTLSGGAGDDQLISFGGSQTLQGGDGNDRLLGYGGVFGSSGGAGSDHFDGGNGNGDWLEIRQVSALSNLIVDLADGSGSILGGNPSSFTVSGIENLAGSDGDDNLIGNTDANILDGRGGNDVLDGAAGDDRLLGGSGNDLLIGAEGNDTLDGGLNDSEGVDRVDYQGASGGVSVNLALGTAVGAAGNDTLNGIEAVLGSAFNDSLVGGNPNHIYAGRDSDPFEILEGLAGNDSIDGGSDRPTVFAIASYANSANGVIVNLGANRAFNDGFFTEDVLRNIDQVIGSFNDDLLIGGSDSDIFFDGNRFEAFEGGLGNDTIDGGSGNDRANYLNAGFGGVTADLAAGIATSSDGVDTLISIEAVLGSSFADTLSGGNGNNQFEGLGGDDQINGRGGFDEIRFVRSAAPVVVTFSGIGSGTAQDGLGGTDSFINIESVRGSDFNDTLTGHDGDDNFEGRAGDDTLTGNAGTDRVSYASSLSGVVVDLANGTATDSWGDTDTLSGIENILGSQYADTLSGDGGANQILGQGGDDLLIGLDGDDSLDGGGGFDFVSYAGSPAAVHVDLRSGFVSADGFEASDVLRDIEGVVGSAGNDLLSGGSVAEFNGMRTEWFIGGAGSDTLDGGRRTSMPMDDRDFEWNIADYRDRASVQADLVAGTADDGSGIDTLIGINYLIGSAGADTLSGGREEFNHGEFFEGGAGVDTLEGSNGFDVIVYRRAAAGVVVNLGTQTVSNDGDGASDSISGIEGVIGSSHNDTLGGGAGDDWFTGGAGSDSINGGAGRNELSHRMDEDADGDGFGVIVNLSGAEINTGPGGLQIPGQRIPTLNIQARQVLDGWGGQDLITALDGNLASIQDVEGSFFADIIVGDDAANELQGYAGGDVLIGGGGNDSIDGGASGNDIDWVSYVNAGFGVQVELSVGLVQVDGFGGVDRLIDIEGVIGSAHNDILIGGSDARLLGTKFEWFVGLGGADFIDGGRGTNAPMSAADFEINAVSYEFSGAPVHVELATNSATGEGSDTLTGINYVRGSGGDDTLVGGNVATDLAEFFEGGAGNDTISGGSGFDFAVYQSALTGVVVSLAFGNASVNDGEGGIDTLSSIEGVIGSDFSDTLSGTSGAETFDGRAGGDSIDGGTGIDSLSYRFDEDANDDGLGVVVNLSAAGISGSWTPTRPVGYSVAASSAQDGWGDIDRLANLEDVVGSIFADVIVGSSAANRLDGNAGGDLLQGNLGNDTLDGGQVGSDNDSNFDFASYAAAAAGVVVNLGSGSASGADGNDTLFNIDGVIGGNSDDTLVGGSTSQFHGTRFEWLVGGGGNDRLDGGFGGTMNAGNFEINAVFYGGNNPVSVNLASGSASGVGTDVLTGGINYVRGSEADDNLVGGNAATDFAEFFEGGAGADLIDGGSGFDIAVYRNAGSGVAVTLGTGTDSAADGTGSTDTLLSIEGAVGSWFDDVLNGASGSQMFDGRKGHDAIDGGSGIDTATWRLDDDADGDGFGVIINLAGVSQQNGYDIGKGFVDYAIDSRSAIDGWGDHDSLSGIESVQGSFFADILHGGGFDLSAYDFTRDAPFERFEGMGGDDTIFGGSSAPTFFAIASYANSIGAVSVNLGTGFASDGWGDSDRLVDIDGVVGSVFADQLVGGSASTQITDSGFFESFEGGLGNDSIDGGFGTDRVSYQNAASGVTVNLASGTATGGDGNDRLISIEQVRGSNSADSISGDSGDNQFEGLGGNDSFQGGLGNDQLRYGYAGNGIVATFSGSGSGSVTVVGGSDVDSFSGIESIRGSDLDDTMIGSSGSESFMGMKGADHLDGGDGLDSVSYAVGPAGAGVSVDLGNLTAIDNWGNTDTLLNIENIEGSHYADTLTGNAGVNTINGLGGDDLIIDSNGTDSIDGGSGIDTVSYAAETSPIAVNLASGNVLIDGLGDDHLQGIERVIGGSGDDTLVGGNPNHQYRFTRDDPFEAFVGGAGNDTLDGGSSAPTRYAIVDYSSNGTLGVEVDLGAGFASDGLGGSDSLFNIDAVIGTDFADTLTGGSGSSQLVDGNLFESFEGGLGNDTIDGAGGTDRVSYQNAASGVSVTLADAGDGTATGGDDNDVLRNIEQIRGSMFNDTLTGNAGDNQFEGLAGIDVIHGGGGIDQIRYSRSDFGVFVSFTGIGVGSASDGFGGADSFDGIEAVRGSDFDDRFVGAAGNESFEGMAGNDSISGGLGLDRVSYFVSPLRDDFNNFFADGVEVNLGQGFAHDSWGNTDTLAGIEQVTGSLFDDLLIGGGLDAASIQGRRDDPFELFEGLRGQDTIDGGSASPRHVAVVSYAASPVSGDGVNVSLFRNDLGRGHAEHDGYGFVDLLFNIDGLIGSSADDTLAGGSNSASIAPGRLFEFFEGGLGDDTIDGQGGEDLVIYANAGAGVEVTLSDGPSGTATGGDGNDVLIGIEDIRGSNFDDILTGNSDNNEIEGLGGDDFIDGGSGIDRISFRGQEDPLGVTVVFIGADSGTATATGTGGSGIDSFVGIESVRGSDFGDQLTGAVGSQTFIGMAGLDAIDGGADVDTASYELSLAGVDVNLLNGLANDDGFGSLDFLTSIENLTGSEFNDLLAGDGNDNRIDGRGGDDLVVAGDGNDILIGGQGVDRLNYASETGAIQLDFGAGTVVHDSGDATDSISGFEAVIGSQAADTLTGGGLLLADYRLHRDDPVQYFAGRQGSDTIDGGSADPTFLAIADYRLNDSGDGGVNADLFAGTGSDFNGTDSLANIDGVIGSDFNDTLAGGSSSAQIIAGNLFEYFAGGLGNDTIDGRDGIDLVSYENASGRVDVNLAIQTATGADGNDQLVGIEQVRGSKFDDVLTGDDLDNQLEGYGGNDFIDGRGGFDVIAFTQASGPVSVDFAQSLAGSVDGHVNFVDIEGVRGSDFADTLLGSSGNESFEGMDGADTINGGDGADRVVYRHSLAGVRVTLADQEAIDAWGNVDRLFAIEDIQGSFFADTLYGSSGENVIEGLGGGDTLTGALGFDTFAFSRGGAGTDVITDFSALDVIRVKDAIFAKQYVQVVSNGSGLGLNQVGRSADNSFLYIGTDGTPGADITISLNPDTLDLGAEFLVAEGDSIRIYDGRPSFAVGDGRITLGSGFTGASIALDPLTGRSTIAGTFSGDGSDFFVRRLLHDATADGSFSSDGSAIASFGPDDQAFDSLRLPDGRLIVVGAANDDFALAMFNPDGSPDTGFDADGMSSIDMFTGGTSHDEAHAVARLSEGQLVIVGIAGNPDGEDAGIAVIGGASGALDAGFGTGGRLVHTAANLHAEYNGVAVDASNRIVVVGSDDSGPGNGNQLIVERYNSAGIPVGSFTLPVFTGASSGNDVVIQSDQKIVVAATTSVGGQAQAVLMRFNADGTLDNSFSDDGVVQFAVGGLPTAIERIALQGDRIVVVGNVFQGESQDPFVARVTANGSADNSFSGDGFINLDFGGTTADHASDLALGADGRITIIGSSLSGVQSQVALARLDFNGNPDGSFDDVKPNSTLGGTVTYNKGNPGVVIDADVSAYDPEAAGVGDYRGSSLILQRSGGAVASDQFGFQTAGAGFAADATNLLRVGGSNPGTHLATLDISGGRMSINFNGSLAVSQAEVDSVLRHITFANNVVANGPATLRWDFFDKAGQAINDFSTVNIAGALVTNVAPLANPDSFSLGEDSGPLTLNVLANDSDANGDALTLVSVSGTPRAVVAGNSIAYTPGNAFQTLKAGATASETLTYVVRDPAGLTSSASVTLTITGANDAPVAPAPIADRQLASGRAFEFTLPQFTDADGDPLTYTLTRADGSALPTRLLFDAATRRLSGDPTNAEAGTLNLRFTATDPDGLSASSLFRISIDRAQVIGNTATVTDPNQVIEGDGQTVTKVIAQANFQLPENPDIKELVLEGEARVGTGNSADNTITGSSGDDTLDGAAGDDTLTGGSGQDTMDGGEGGDTIDGGDGNDDLDGGEGGDTLDGGSGDDILAGGEGGDTLSGGAGINLLNGGGGNDTALLEGSLEDYQQDGGRIEVEEAAGSAFTLNGLAPGDVVKLTSRSGRVDRLIGVEQVSFTSGGTLAVNREQLLSNVEVPGAVFTSGTDGPDVSNGTTGSDSFDGLAGDDTITGNSGNDNLAGSAGSDTLSGGAGNDVLDGGSGGDSMDGGAGDDTYYVDSSTDLVSDSAGRDTIVSRLIDSVFDLGLYSSIENLTTDLVGNFRATGNTLANTLTGSDGDDTLGGSGGNDALLGNAGNDSLDGGVGADVMTGGSGNDSYTVDNAADRIVELAEGGTDTIRAQLGSYSIASLLQVENLAYVGNAAGVIGNFTGTGNSGNNTLTGNSGSDNLNGGAGNDSLAGLSGNDRLDGSSGDDRLDGGEGNDTLTGGVGNDNLIASAGNDSFDAGAGTDALDLSGLGWLSTGIGQTGAGGISVARPRNNQLTLTDAVSGQKLTVIGLWGASGANDRGIESFVFSDATLSLDELTANTASEGRDTYVGSTGSDSFDGLGGDDTISGGDGDDTLLGGGGNDTISGGGDADTLNGGLGNDTYRLGDALDTLTESGGGGSDTVRLDGLDSFTLGAGFEHLIQDRSSAATLTGNSGANSLTGNAGNDSLDGAGGADVMSGLGGDDSYTVDSATDRIIEAADGGTDSVRSQLASFSIASLLQVENLSYVGSAAGVIGNFTGTGNAGGNSLSGNSGRDKLNGGAGNDSLLGLAGNDTLNGGLGDDTLFGGDGNDALLGGDVAGNVGSDTVVLSGNRTDYQFSRVSGDNVTLNRIVSVTHKTSGEVDTLTGIERVIFADTPEGRLLNALPASETQSENGLLLNTSSASGDTYVDDPANTEDNDFNGLNGNDSISGGAGVNTLQGGNGNDSINGGGGDDVLDGGNDNDSLDGGSGADTMSGGLGNDVFTVDAAGDLVQENLNQGTDSIRTTLAAFSLAERGANVERLLFVSADGGTGSDDFSGSGNELANLITGGTGNDTLSGGAGNDTLQGGDGNDTLAGEAGADRLEGGAGDDTYRLDGVSGSDSIIEAVSGGGTDSVELNGLRSYTLVNGVENLTVAGADGVNAKGNGVANTLSGGSGNDTLDGLGGDDLLLGGDGNDTLLGGAGVDTLTGGAGDDRLSGGSGNDRFVFDAGFGADRITDFVEGNVSPDDIIDLDDALFADFAAVQAAMTQVGADVVIDAGGGNTLTIAATTIAALAEQDFSFH